MKIPITFKSPDSVLDAIKSAVQDSLEGCRLSDPEERESVEETRTELYTEILSTWVRYNEYITVELDTETHSIKVLPA